MKKQTVFIKRYPSKGELPKDDNKDYCSNVGMVYFRKLKFYFRDEQLITFTDKVEWFLEEIELPSEDDIESYTVGKCNPSKEDKLMLSSWKQGVNFILNKLKGGTK